MAVVATPLTLYCDRCGNRLPLTSHVAVRVVALFRPSIMPELPRTDPHELRSKCRDCGFVNVFHPVEEAA